MDHHDTPMSTTIAQCTNRIQPSQTLTRRTGSSPPSMPLALLRAVPARHYRRAGCGGEAEAAGCRHEPRYPLAGVVALFLALARRARRPGGGTRLGRHVAAAE